MPSMDPRKQPSIRLQAWSPHLLLLNTGLLLVVLLLQQSGGGPLRGAPAPFSRRASGENVAGVSKLTLPAVTSGPMDADAYRGLGTATKQVTLGPGKAVTVTAGARNSGFWGHMHDSGVWVWEPETQSAFQGCIVPGATTVVDFGSWIGPTVLWSSVLGAKYVYSFEPDPFAYAELVTNIKLSGVSNVAVHNGCINPSGGSTQLYLRDGNSVSSTYNISTDGNGKSGMGYSRTVDVQCWRLEDVMSHYDMQGPLFIKVDTEGFEIELAPSLKRVALSYKPTMHLSIHSQLRKFSAADWAAIVDLASAFPVVMEPAGGAAWKPVGRPVAEAAQEWAAKPINMELLLTWPGECAGLANASH